MVAAPKHVEEQNDNTKRSKEKCKNSVSSIRKKQNQRMIVIIARMQKNNIFIDVCTYFPAFFVRRLG